jgi:hypothetical protein
MKLASKLLICISSLLYCLTAVGQEYKYEIGGQAGMSMYMGDANQSSLFKDWNPSAGVVFRNNFDFRWALKADLSWGKVSGSTKNTDNAFPNLTQEYSFSRSFFDLGGQMEFNFLPYSDKFPYLGTSKITPYMFLGLGVALATGGDNTFFSLNLPMGVGVKYKLRNRLNLGLEFTVHKLFGDGLDSPNKNGFNLDNPYNVENGFFKNKDWYNTLYISITWEFGLRDGRCM